MNANYKQQIVSMLQGMKGMPQQGQPMQRPTMQQVQPPPMQRPQPMPRPSPMATTPAPNAYKPGPMPSQPPVKRVY